MGIPTRQQITKKELEPEEGKIARRKESEREEEDLGITVGERGRIAEEQDLTVAGREKTARKQRWSKDQQWRS